MGSPAFSCPSLARSTFVSLPGAGSVREAKGVTSRNARRLGPKITPRCVLQESLLKPALVPPPRFYTFDPNDVEAIRIRHVLVHSEELAQTVFEMVRKKESTLAQLAQSLSVCQVTRGNGGDLGWWYTNEKVSSAEITEKLGMNQQLLSAALASDANKLTKLKSAQGYHIFVVDDIRHKFKATQRLQVGKVQKSTPKTSKSFEAIPMTYSIVTLGCQMNRADSERMAGEMERLGYTELEDAYKASVIILNTCSIRDHAEGKVYSYLGKHAQRKRYLPGKVTLCVAGCVAQQEGEKLLRRVPELDIVIGPQYCNRLGDIIEDVQLNHVQIAATEPIYIQEDLSKPMRQSTVTAWVNVIYGCNERCTYCVVPNVRGLEQSRSVESIVAEVSKIAQNTSCREVVLLGQNVDAYGRDLYPRRTFAELLAAVHQVDGIDRIRFTTSHPRYISMNLIDTIADLPKIMPSFNIPPQSGDNDILREMKRGYTAEKFLAIVARIRDRIPDASITGDAIVGFPGESEQQFENTLELMRNVVFDTLHTAAYSPRPNTDAALYTNQVDDKIKVERLHRINQLVNEHAQIQSNRFIGRTVHVLVENANAKHPGQVIGRNEHNRVVVFPGDINSLKGMIVPVKISTATPFTIIGEQDGAAY